MLRSGPWATTTARPLGTSMANPKPLMAKSSGIDHVNPAIESALRTLDAEASGVVAISEPRGAFYRDVPPGHYHISVDSFLSGDFNQEKDVDLAPGQQAYFKVLWSEFNCGGGVGGGDGGGGGGDCQRANFYVWTIPAEIAQGDMARIPFYGGS